MNKFTDWQLEALEEEEKGVSKDKYKDQLDNKKEEEKSDEASAEALHIIETAYQDMEGVIGGRKGYRLRTDLLARQIDKLTLKAREVFVPIHGYGGEYSVSNTGKVYSNKNKILLQPSIRYKKGYLCVTLSHKNIQKLYNIHRLVAVAFIPNLESKRTVNHKDGDKLNNNLENLEWATYSENEKHSYDVLKKVNANHPDRLKQLKGEK